MFAVVTCVNLPEESQRNTGITVLEPAVFGVIRLFARSIVGATVVPPITILDELAVDTTPTLEFAAAYAVCALAYALFAIETAVCAILESTFAPANDNA